MNEQMKLYVWDDVLHDYSGGIAFAMAATVREAKRLLIESGIPEIRWDGYKLDGQKVTVSKVPTCGHCWGGG